MGDYAQSQATQSASAMGARAPASHAHEPLPTSQELMQPAAAPSLDGISAERVLDLMKGFLKTANDGLRRNLTKAVTALGELPPPPPTDAVAAALAKMVEILTGFALNGISRAAFGVFEKNLGNEDGSGSASDALGDVGKEIGKKGGPALGSLFLDASAPATRTDEFSAKHLVDPSAKNLLEEFEERQQRALDDALMHGAVNVEQISARLRRIEPARITRLAEELRASAGSFGTLFQYRVTSEWLNFRARLSLEHEAGDPGPAFAGANAIGGLHPMAEGYKTWRYGNPNGLLKIYIDVPDQLYGISGLALESIALNDGPGAIRILKAWNLPLSQVPIYRQIWFRQPSSPITSTEPAFVLTPDHQQEIDLGNPVLAAIGSMRPVAFEDAAETRTMTRPGPVPATADVFRAGQTKAGAAVVSKWLTLFTTEKLP